MKTVYDVAVVGAGPYGLSTAAHLLGQGLRVAVFGRTLEMWREHMPGGMLLRSHWWATNLSDPRHAYGFARFFAESQWDRVYPLPFEAFIDYGCWFQQRAVPQVEETYVASVEYRNGRFLLTLEDGREVESGAVVMAVGLYYYANRPEPYASIPDGLVSHSFEHRDFRRFAAGRHRDRRRTEWDRVRRPAPRGRCRRPGRIAAAHQLAPARPDGNARRARTTAGPGRGDRAWLGQLGVGPPALPVLPVPPIMEGPIQRQLPARSKRLAADQSLGQDRAPRGPNGGQCGRGERQSRCHTLRRRAAEC